jgi:hypothetical protein
MATIDWNSTRSIGSRLELFVDDWLIQRLQGASLQLHAPVEREVALPFDRPWEGIWSACASYLRVGDEYRMYYRGLPEEQALQVTGVATSRDGITFQRPSLGLYEYNGSRDNNIVWTGDASHNLTPFEDLNPAALPEERFKAIGTVQWQGRPALAALVSPDGYHWRRWREEPIITDGAFDSHNIAFWDAHRGCYVAFYRDFRGGKKLYEGVRAIKYASSHDFLHWTPGQWEDYGSTPEEHLYTNATTAYFRAPHIYLSFPMRFLPERTAVPEHGHTGVSDAVLKSSRDGVHWHRFMEGFMRPGRERDNWTQRSHTPSWGIVQTAPDEISLYWVEHYAHPTCRQRRGSLRLDGFVSVNAGYGGGELLTRPLVFTGRELVLNYATSAAGSVRVEVQDPEGHPIPGYTLDDCPEMYGDEIDGVVRWQGGSVADAYPGRPVRLRLALKDADLYALRFRP